VDREQGVGLVALRTGARREREREERKDEERKKKQAFPNLPIFIDAD
jgi:hypothetical protein